MREPVILFCAASLLGVPTFGAAPHAAVPAAIGRAKAADEKKAITVEMVKRQLGLLDDDVPKTREEAYALLESWIDEDRLTGEAMAALLAAERGESVEVRRSARRLRLHAEERRDRRRLADFEIKQLMKKIMQADEKVALADLLDDSQKVDQATEAAVDAAALEYQPLGKSDRKALTDLLVTSITDKANPSGAANALRAFKVMIKHAAKFGVGDAFKKQVRGGVTAIALDLGHRNIKPTKETYEVFTVTSDVQD